MRKLHLPLGLELCSFFNLDSNPGQQFDQRCILRLFCVLLDIENVTARKEYKISYNLSSIRPFLRGWGGGGIRKREA